MRIASAPAMAQNALSQLSHLVVQVGDILAHVESAVSREEYARYMVGGNTDGSGFLQMDPIIPRAGHAIKLVSFSASMGPFGTAASGSLAFYIDAYAPQNLLKVAAATSQFDDSFQEGQYIPENGILIPVWQGAAASQPVYVNVWTQRLTDGPKERSDRHFSTDIHGATESEVFLTPPADERHAMLGARTMHESIVP